MAIKIRIKKVELNTIWLLYSSDASWTDRSQAETPPGTFDISSCKYFVGSPNPIWSSDTKYDPAKSLIIPELVHIPMCPIKGKSHLKK